MLGDGTCVLSQTTDLLVGYAFSAADYAQNNFAGGLPLGIQYQRHSAQAGLDGLATLKVTLSYRLLSFRPR